MYVWIIYKSNNDESVLSIHNKELSINIIDITNVKSIKYNYNNIKYGDNINEYKHGYNDNYIDIDMTRKRYNINNNKLKISIFKIVVFTDHLSALYTKCTVDLI